MEVTQMLLQIQKFVYVSTTLFNLELSLFRQTTEFQYKNAEN